MSAEPADGHPADAVGAAGVPGAPCDPGDDLVDGPGEGPGAVTPGPVVLPEPVRRRVVDLAAACLGALAGDDVPASLRRVARFEPRRRARLAATQIALALETDEEFRGHVADGLRSGEPDLSAAVEAGTTPAAADPADVAAAAYLLRPDGWRELVEGAGEAVERRVRARHADAELDRIRERDDTERAEAKREVDRLAGLLDTTRAEVRTLRTRLHEERERVRAAFADRTAAETALADAARERDEQADAVGRAEVEARRLRARIAELEAQAGAGRRSARADRADEAARLAVLVDTMLDAAHGLRRELALPVDADARPGDAVRERYEVDRGAVDRRTDATGAARPDDDPAAVDRVLAQPRLHLVVDGYNVSKTGWPDLTLQRQRARLLSGLGALAARSRTEITCVFDGTDLGGRVPVGSGRDVRVVFSPAGTTADDVIAELVAAEPPGRPLAVVSSDREVADGARRAGARTLSAAALVARLARA